MPLQSQDRQQFFKHAVDALIAEDELLRASLPASIRTQLDATYSSVVHLPERIVAYLVMRRLRQEGSPLVASIEQGYPNQAQAQADLVLAAPGGPSWDACVEAK